MSLGPPTVFFLVMLLILMHNVYLTLKLTKSWRPVRSHSMRLCLVLLLSLNGQVIRRLVRASLLRMVQKMPIGLASSSTTSADGPDPSSSTTWGPIEQPPQPTPVVPEEAPAAVEGRRLLQGKHLDTFSVAIHLRP